MGGENRLGRGGKDQGKEKKILSDCPVNEVKNGKEGGGGKTRGQY